MQPTNQGATRLQFPSIIPAILAGATENWMHPLEDIDQARDQIRRGQTYSIEEVRAASHR